MSSQLQTGDREKALICVGEGYGNIIMATPLIQAVHDLGYAVHVHVAGNFSDAAQLLDGWDAVERVMQGDTHLTVMWDVVIDTAWTRACGRVLAKRRVSPDRLDMRQIHEAIVNLSAASKLGWIGHLPDSHCEFALAAHVEAEPFIACCPGWGGRLRSDWIRKAWPHWDYFSRMASMHCVFLGAESEADLCPPVTKDASRILGRPIGDVAAILKKAQCVVAVDNGLAHMAAALGVRTVVLFGATSEVKNRPLGRDVTVLTANGLTCRPCQMLDRWGECTDWRCMREITIKQVLEAIA